MEKLRKLLIAIYEYQVSTPGSSTSGIEEEKVISYLAVKYKAPSERVRGKIEELRKIGIISDLPIDNSNGTGKFEITARGYKLKRSWLAGLWFK